ncbi:hypothetical protein JCM11641_007730 [Rhodosporidiobolus odoratus]
MAQASPFLLSLGVSKSMMSVVFLAGPLSGLIVQPLVGVFSDSCKSPLGRRRPFIIGGVLLTSVAVMMLGWSKEIAGMFADEGGVVYQRLAIACAVVSVYIIDFAVNVVMAMDRSLLVDVVTPAQQPAANAWASRMFGFGAVFGYWIGGIDLVWLTGGWLGGEQLKVLTFFTSFFLILTHAITCASVQERVLISRDDDRSGGGPFAALEDIWNTIRTLPKPIQQVFNVQFTGWIGWFPVLFFSTTWVAEIYVRTQWGDAQSDLASAPSEVRDRATRAGTHAMLWHSIVSLSTSILLPPLVAGAGGEESQRGRDRSYRFDGGNDGRLEVLKRMMPALPLQWLSLPLLWTFSNAVFATLLFSTWFATSVGGASFVVAAAGFAWSVTNWAPFAILGDLILRLGPSSASTSPNGSHIMLHRPSSELEALYNPSRENMLSPIPEESSDYASSAASYRKTPRPGQGSSSRAAPPGSIGLPASAAFFSPSQSPAGSSSTDVPFTPTTTTSHRSYYFDATSSLPSSRAESFADSSSASGGSRTPTLTASPEAPSSRYASPQSQRYGLSSPSSAPQRMRQDSTASAASAASSFAYPPNHGSAGLDLLGEPFSSSSSTRGAGVAARQSSEYFGADPYAYRPYGIGASAGAGGASTSTIQLPLSSAAAAASAQMDDDGDQTLQIRHSGSFDLPGSERETFERHREGEYELDLEEAKGGSRGGKGEPETPSTIRAGGLGFESAAAAAAAAAAAGSGGGGRSRTPRIIVGSGEEGNETEEWEGEEQEGLNGHGSGGAQAGGGDQTGVILGCHNIYLVLPQFLVTALSSIIFALLAPHHSVLSAGSHHGAGVTTPKDPAGTSNSTTLLGEDDEYRTMRLAVRALVTLGEAMMEKRQEEEADLPGGGEGGWDALGLIFRLGGISACASTYVCYKMWRDQQRAQERQRAVGRGYRLG